jgi:hypothetical protein
LGKLAIHNLQLHSSAYGQSVDKHKKAIENHSSEQVTQKKESCVEGNWGYRIFTGKVGLIEIVGMRHVTPPKFAFKSNRCIWTD